MTVIPLHSEPECTPVLLPVRPRLAGGCIVPACEEPTRLYAGGWLCEAHKPGAPLAAVDEGRSA